MDAPPPTKSSPPLQFAVRARDNLSVFNNFEGQVVFQTDLTNLRLVEYSTDGSLLAVVGNAVLLLNAETGEKVFAYDSPDVQAAVFSPMNSFLLTWERFKKPEPGQQPPNNLLVWDIKTGKQVAGFVQKSMSENWPSIQWTQDESICGRVVTNEIQFSSSKDIGFISNRKKLPNVAKFSFSPDSKFFATFVPEKGTTPAAIAICKYPTGDVVVQKTFFKAQTVNFLWNSTSTALVALAETDVDKTGKSYYGETNIHFLRTDGSKNESIDLGNSGPIHNCVWAPDGKIFLVTYGFMPARSTLFDIEGNKFADFGTAHRNTAKFSPNGRLLCIAGFGNLQGEMDIWDWRKLKKIGSAVAHCAAYYDWSPDSCYLLTGVLCPRIRVDNGYQLWTNDGTLIKKVDVEQLYQVSWRPASPSLFSGFVMPKPIEVAQKAKTPAAAEAKPAAAKPSVYRHPNFSGSSLPPSLHSKKEEAPQKFKKQQAAPKSYAPPLPPGAEPVLSKAALKNQKKRAKKKTPGQSEKNDEKEEEETEAQTEAQPQAQSEESQETQDPSKKIKNLQKKLKQIRQLKEQKASGKALDAAQQTKLTTEQSVVDEILALGGTVE